MDFIFTPWRYAYVSGADIANECVFCAASRLGDDKAAWIVYRFFSGETAWRLLNLARRLFRS